MDFGNFSGVEDCRSKGGCVCIDVLERGRVKIAEPEAVAAWVGVYVFHQEIDVRVVVCVWGVVAWGVGFEFGNLK